ncbi:MAG: peptidase [Pseudarthrobacter sp.]|nr:peptidase [Pseudarthrobacter sp.]
MAKHSGKLEAPTRRRGRNRFDAAILACGVLGFLTFTVGLPLLDQQDVHGPAAGAVVPSSAVRSSLEVPLALAGSGISAAPEAPAAALPPETAAASAPAAAPASAGPVLPPASAPQRIVYPAASIDVAVHPLEPDSSAVESQTIVPPTTMDGYWLTPFGVPGSGSKNTTYIVGHSWEGRDAPFNHLSSAAVAGHDFDVVTATGTVRYRVDGVTTYLKSALKDSPIWEIAPNRLILVSCYTEDPWGKNVVVAASPVHGQ